MLAIIPVNSASVTSRGELSVFSQRCASARSPPRISLHAGSSTAEVFHAASHVASANGLPPSLAHRFIRDSPYRRCCACAAIVAPPLTERDASAADILSSDRRRPRSPELRMNAPVRSLVPSTSSENRRVRAGLASVVCMRVFDSATELKGKRPRHLHPTL